MERYGYLLALAAYFVVIDVALVVLHHAQRKRNAKTHGDQLSLPEIGATPRRPKPSRKLEPA